MCSLKLCPKLHTQSHNTFLLELFMTAKISHLRNSVHVMNNVAVQLKHQVEYRRELHNTAALKFLEHSTHQPIKANSNHVLKPCSRPIACSGNSKARTSGVHEGFRHSSSSSKEMLMSTCSCMFGSSAKCCKFGKCFNSVSKPSVQSVRSYTRSAKPVVSDDVKEPEKCLAEDGGGVEMTQPNDEHEGSEDRDLVLSSENEQGLMGVQETGPDDSSLEVPDSRGTSVADLSLPDLARLRPATLAPYVNRSETLQKMVQLGVDLSIVQQVPNMGSLLVQSKFERDIFPYVQFLHNAGVPADKMGHVLTVNPHIFTMPLEELEIKIGYLVHKKFTVPQIGAMIGRAPVVLLMSPEQLDGKLAFLQKTFGLTASEVRQVVMMAPRLLPYKKNHIALVRYQVKSFLGFEEEELKALMLKEPGLYMTEFTKLENNFNYLHHNMQIPHDLLLAFPGVMLHRGHVVKTRHLFLLSRRRAQYDPTKENYVSLKALVSGSDEEFCQRVAKSDLKSYYEFLKTL